MADIFDERRRGLEEEYFQRKDKESLEQLRVLEAGAAIRVVEVAESSVGVDTEADLERVRKILSRKSNAQSPKSETAFDAPAEVEL